MVKNNEWLDPIVEQYKEYFGDKASIVFDVGSRDGHDAFYIGNQLKTRHVYTIDANPLAIENIKKNYPRFKTFYTAIHEYDGTTEFTQIVSDNKDHEGSSSIENFSFFEDATYNTITVPVTRMDTFIESNKLQEKTLDIVKVDIEGYSYEFIMGMGEYVYNVKLFHLEAEMFDRHPGHKNNNLVIDLMTERGFLLCHTSYQWEGIQDQIWINSRLIR
jgi:FkbM family methyltransferase